MFSQMMTIPINISMVEKEEKELVTTNITIQTLIILIHKAILIIHTMQLHQVNLTKAHFTNHKITTNLECIKKVDKILLLDLEEVVYIKLVISHTNQIKVGLMQNIQINKANNTIKIIKTKIDMIITIIIIVICIKIIMVTYIIVIFRIKEQI